jgi:hypothetical protein
MAFSYSPMLILNLFRDMLRASVGAPLPPLLSAVECLNICGGAVFLLCVHNLMRKVIKRLFCTTQFGAKKPNISQDRLGTSVGKTPNETLFLADPRHVGEHRAPHLDAIRRRPFW